MGRILFGSEFGANLGHIYPLMRIAEKLSKSGHDIVFAARNLVQTSRVLEGTGYQLVQAPFWHNLQIKDPASKVTPSYSDILALQGFGFSDNLQSFLRAWTDLVDIVKPDLVIADHSPCLSLAVRNRYPMINMGNGFTLPPSNMKEFPAVITKGRPLVAQAELLAQFNKVLVKNHRPPLDYLPQIFDTQGQYVRTVPQLDPYTEYRDYAPVGPLEECLDYTSLPKEDHVFLYMSHDAGRDNVVLKALKALDLKTTAYVRGATADMKAEFAGGNITMLSKPADFRDIIPKASFVIHSGGCGTSTTCLMTGRPQIVFPTQAEAFLNSRLMKKEGVAFPMDINTKLDDLTGLMDGAFKNSEIKENAKRVALELEQGDWKSALSTIVAHAERLIGN